VFARQVDRGLADLKLAPQVLAAIEAQRMKLGAAEVPPAVPAPERIVVEQVLAEAFVSGFRRVAWLGAALALASAATAAVMIDGRMPRVVGGRRFDVAGRVSSSSADTSAAAVASLPGTRPA